MTLHLAEDDVPVLFVPKFREYGVTVLDGGSSFIGFGFCPWCGTQLAESLRNVWFNKLEAAGIDPGVDEVPEQYRSDEWWKRRDS